jgi:3-hydroxyisobutyrate dehydrogenase-like beta-hydroxyacid dehydrogenase
MDIGMVGLGHMGSAVATRLLDAGHDLTVYNRTASKAEALLAKGATLAHDPEGTASGDIVITMLADDKALESVLFGDSKNGDGSEGLIAHQSKNTIHISMSTISASLSRRIDAGSTAAAKKFISAPVMGRPDVAQRGELIVMPAGDRGLIKKCTPVFEAIGKKIHVIGEHPVQANIAKLAANFMISSMIETFSEAFALVRKNDIDHHEFLDIMASGFFASPIYEKYGKLIADGKFKTGAFTVRLQEKDTRLALEAAIESQVPMPFASVIENAFLSAIGQGKGDLDPCAISEIALENAGIKS